jgi:hypothetical protein
MRCQLALVPGFVGIAAVTLPGCHARIEKPALRTAETVAATRYRFSPADEQLLDEIQFACFQYFWKEVGEPAKLVKDRMKGPVASIAAVGFQLSSLPIGVERKWITRAEGEERARAALKSLVERGDNKKWGMYLHFPDLNTGGMSHHGYESEASTVDTALLIAGAIPAAEYFGGPVKALVDRLIAEANWRKYAVGPGGFISMAWKPDDRASFDGPGKFLEWYWTNASDEERLVYFLAVAAPNSEFTVPPTVYYQLKRTLKQHDEMPMFVVSWPGTLFTYFFSHCWIDYRSLPADDPARVGAHAPRVDWFENSRRAVLTHRQRCIELSARFRTLARDRWGLSACAARDGYIVPQIRPNLSDRDELYEGTIAPYAAGSAVMFTPAESVRALRAFRALKDADGKPFVWRDPETGGYGFVDSFNLDQNYAHDDYVGIDQGPMLLAIENVRTGLIWKLFMQSATAQRGVERLRLAN